MNIPPAAEGRHLANNFRLIADLGHLCSSALLVFQKAQLASVQHRLCCTSILSRANRRLQRLAKCDQRQGSGCLSQYYAAAASKRSSSLALRPQL